jgi:hypothetical protein
MKLVRTPLVALSLCLAPLAVGCADVERPNSKGGTHYPMAAVNAGQELHVYDSCDACCDPDHSLPWCEGGDGDGGGWAGAPSGGGHAPCYFECWPGGPGGQMVCVQQCPSGGSGDWP